MIKKGTRYPHRLARNGADLQLLFRGARPIWVSQATARTAKKAWLDEHVFLTASTTADSTARWFDLEIVMPDDFTGSPEDGWTNGTIELGLIYTLDLTNRQVVDWITTPGSSVEDLGDGGKRHYARCTVPVQWLQTLVDFTLTCDRQGKSITSISLLRSAVSLSGFPYAMPADASRLQTDLRAAGFTGATVTSTSAAVTVSVRNYTATSAHVLTATMSGSNVTAMAEFGTSITLSGFPYAMPSQRASLQADLRTAGFTGAVVTLHDDPWTITLPDVVTTDFVREFTVMFTPGDPFPVWDFQGTPQDDNPANFADGQVGNIRDIYGASLREEIPRAFAAMRITNEATLP
jgi:hypothetical protein